MSSDIKPENVLLENNKDVSQIKLADFGTSLQWDPESREKALGRQGTPLYMAPEVYANVYDEK